MSLKHTKGTQKEHRNFKVHWRTVQRKNYMHNVKTFVEILQKFQKTCIRMLKINIKIIKKAHNIKHSLQGNLQQGSLQVE